MEQYTDDQLDQMLGTGTKGFTKFKKITVDNGTDTAGTGATGNFVERTYDQETKQNIRHEYADVFQGVVLAAKTQLRDKGQFPTWMTNEFDAANFDETINIFPLKEGKMVKNAAGKYIFETVGKTFITNEEGKKVPVSAYRQIQSKQSVRKPDGKVENLFNYVVILYVGVMGEVIKLEFKGTSRGNYFDYAKAVAQLGAKLYNISTVFSTYRDKTTGKFAIKFAIDRDENGNIVEVDPEEIRAMRIQVARTIQDSFTNKIALEAPKASGQISGPQPAQQAPAQTETVNSDQINWEELGNDQEEVPFEG